MTPLHRHQLALLGEAGWRSIQDRDWDATARDCLAHWAAERLPLVVTRQVASAGEDAVALGLPAPGRWSRRRLALSVARSEVLYFDEFPSAEKVCSHLPMAARGAWRALCAGLKAVHANAHVYGSYGWELLSGLDHVRRGSDIDLWLSVADAEQADAVTACLQAFSGGSLRLDGELMFADGSAVAWREWQAWRSGQVKALLVKSLGGSALVRSPAGHGPATLLEAR
nr:malonate decarboxylase holo-[acyl-carrier-protein] synthase [uncultured Roseateles sp.]